MLSALTGSLRWATGVAPGVKSGVALAAGADAGEPPQAAATSPIVTAAASVRTRAKGTRRSAVRIADGMLARGPRTTDPPVRMAGFAMWAMRGRGSPARARPRGPTRP